MQQQKRHVEFTVVGDCLVEGLLGQGHSLRLALDEEKGGNPTPSLPRREGEITIDHGVAANKPTPVPSLKGREMKATSTAMSEAG